MSLPGDVLRARAYLSRVAEPGHRAVWTFVAKVGPLEAADRIRCGRVPPAVASATESRRDGDPDADLEAAERHAIRLVAPESDDWPHFAFAALERAGAQGAALDPTLRGVPRRDRPGGSDLDEQSRSHEPAQSNSDERARSDLDERVRSDLAERGRSDLAERGRSDSNALVPPLALWVRGNAELGTLGFRSVGIVGARACTAYGDHVTRELAYGLSRADVIVVSGGAYGIDAAAHRAALAGGGTTVLVSAGGLDRPYPPSHGTLFEQVAGSGLLLSESPPGCAPQRHRFLSRNRVIAALSTGVLIVEAALRSGAANTASHAAALGRPVLAVPGPITSPMSAGCHRLLRLQPSPAVLVTCVDDVLAVIGSPGEGLPEPGSGSTAADLRDELDRLDPVVRRVFDGLPARRFAAPDEIAARSGVGALVVMRSLPVLELAGLLEPGDGGYRIAARVRRRPE